MATSGGERDHRRAWTHDNISLFLFLILFLSPCPDQMVDRRREMMSAALIVGGGRDT